MFLFSTTLSYWEFKPPVDGWQGGTLWIAIGPDLCKYTIMNKTQMTNTLQELQDFMFDTMFPADMCVDWYCDRFNVSATDEVIDFVLDAHDAFHGNWYELRRNSQSLEHGNPRRFRYLQWTLLPNVRWGCCTLSLLHRFNFILIFPLWLKRPCSSSLDDLNALMVM